jgi:mannose-1-phosphate guanylyltransferase
MTCSDYSRVKAILLAAGPGTRLRPLTNSIPKCLLPIGGKPLLQYWFEKLVAAGVREVLVNTHWLHEKVEAFIATWDNSNLKVAIFYEPMLLGTAGTIMANRAFWEEASELLILYADNFTTVRLEDILKFHRSHNFPFTLGVFETDEPQRCGIVVLDPKGVVIEFIEKPKNPRTNLAAGGIYVANPGFLKEVLDWNWNFTEPYDLGYHVLPRLVGRMMAYRLQGLLLDIGIPESYQYAQEIYNKWRLFL